MSLETELSYEEMQDIRANELSSLIISTYKDANKQIISPKESNLKLKWAYAQINANMQSYLIYLDKYMKGDKSLFRPIKDYLVNFYQAEVSERNGYEQIKLYSEMQKSVLFKYATISTIVFAFIIPLIGIPAAAMSFFYVKKKSRLKKRIEEIELDAAFKEAALEDLKELKENDFELALNLAKEKFK